MIIAKRSHLVVTDYVWDDCKKLQYRFAIYDRVCHRTFYTGLEWEPETRTLYLPRGNDLRTISDLLQDQVVIDKEYTPWKDIGEVKIKYLPKNEVQVKAIKFILGLDEYSYTTPYSQLLNAMGTGRGKTYVTIAAMAYEQSRFIVITSINSWLKQWIEKILEYTDINRNEILQLNTSIMRRIINGSFNISRYKVFTACHASFHRLGKEDGWRSVDELFEKLQVKYKVYDESHLYFDSMSKIDFHSNVFKTIYLTASPYRSGDKENEIYRQYFEYVPSIELFDKKKDAVTKYLSIHYNSHPNSTDQLNMRTKYGFNKPAYCDYSIHNKYFWKIVYVIFCEAILLNPGRTLLLTEINRPMPTLVEWIEYYFPEFKGQIGCFSGETPDSEREKAKQKKIVITNRACGGTCLDIKNLGICCPLLVPAKSKVIAHQLFGRVGREGAILPMFLYIDIVDEGFRQLKEYYTHKLPIFMKYATSCNKILYRDIDLDRSFREHFGQRNQTPTQVPVEQPPAQETTQEHHESIECPFTYVVPPEEPKDNLPWDVVIPDDAI